MCEINTAAAWRVSMLLVKHRLLFPRNDAKAFRLRQSFDHMIGVDVILISYGSFELGR